MLRWPGLTTDGAFLLQAILRRCDDLFAGNDLPPTPCGVALATQTPVDDLAHAGTGSTATGSGGKGGASKREAEAAAFSAAKAQIYYRRQMLGLSLEGRRVDVVTITDWGNGGSGSADEQPDGGPGSPQSPSSPASKISGKKVSDSNMLAASASCYPLPPCIEL